MRLWRPSLEQLLLNLRAWVISDPIGEIVTVLSVEEKGEIVLDLNGRLGPIRELASNVTESIGDGSGAQNSS